MNASPPSNRSRISPGAQSRYRKLPIVGPVLDDVLTWLRHRGYTESTLRNHVKGISRLVRWLQRRRGPALEGLTQADLSSAYDWFRPRRADVAGTTRALARCFREQQLIPEGPCAPLAASERELAAHGAYLREVRGMAESTVEGHQNRLRFFLRFLKFDQRSSAIRRLAVDQVEAFLRQTAKTNNRFSLQHVVASVRGFLQRHHAQGVLRQPLHHRIDTPRTYRLEQLPRALSWGQVVALLRSLDRSQPAGLRDFTLLYLAARYGLRSGELVRLLAHRRWLTRLLACRQAGSEQ